MSKTAKWIVFFLIVGGIIGIYFYEISTNKNIDKDSPYYFNHIYMSDARIYQNYLNDDEKYIYDLLVDNMRTRRHKIEGTLEEFHCPGDRKKCNKDFNKAFDAVIIDHPEILGASGLHYEYNDNIWTVRLYYATNFWITDFYGEARILMLLNDIKKETANMTDEEKIIYVYDWIGEHATYDYAFTYSSKNQSVFNTMVKHNAVCAGFAKTANVIFQAIGIESYSITGHSHMWNIVKYQDKYYYFDSTTAACLKETSDRYYDGLKQETMNDYGVDNEEWYMEIEKTNMPFVNELGEKK